MARSANLVASRLVIWGPAGQALEIIVQAVNGSLQGVPSDAVSFTAPLPVSPVVLKPAVFAAEEVMPRPGTNGNRDGNGHAHPAGLLVG